MQRRSANRDSSLAIVCLFSLVGLTASVVAALLSTTLNAATQHAALALCGGGLAFAIICCAIIAFGQRNA
jgi:hypothetical protein